MKTITIGFSKSKKKIAIGSWAIRAYMKTEYSHTYLGFYSASLDRNLKYEAVGSGVRFIGENQWKDHAIEVKKYDIQISDANYIELMQNCVGNASIDYGFWQNIGVVVAAICRLKKNPFNSGFNCSELVGRILKNEGYKIEKDLNLLTPKDIDIILSGERGDSDY